MPPLAAPKRMFYAAARSQTMQSRWNDDEAEALVTRYAQQEVAPDLALRVYTSRLLGQDSKLVLHGGGNTSVKLRVLDLLGEEVDALCVKGSGWDMANIEPAGLPAVRLAPLLRSEERRGRERVWVWVGAGGVAEKK